MKYIKTLSILLCTVALITALTGCGDPADSNSFYWDRTDDPQTDEPTQPDNVVPSDISNDIEGTQGIDFRAALNTFAPDTIMITIGDYSITWAELFFHMYGYVDYLQQAAQGGSINWSEALSGELTVADAVLDYAVENATMFRALEYGAKLLGISLSQEDLNSLQDSHNTMLE